MKTELTLGSLFDGSGGFPLGGVLAGINPVWASEIEPFPIRVTTKRMPFIKHYGDVSKMKGNEIEPVDIITFGSPCQDMSVAGKRAGLDGSRSNLFYEAIRIVKEMRCATDGKYPRFIVWENVPGAFSSNKGEDFRCVLESISRVKDENISIPKPDKWQHAGCVLGDEFSIAWRLLDAQFWGVPQRRKRIFLVADFTSRSAEQILFKSEGLHRDSAKSFSAWKETTGCSEDCVGETSVNGDINLELYENHGHDARYRGPLDVSPTIAAFFKGGNNQPFVTETPKTLKIRSGCEGGGKGALVQDDKSATLSCNNDQTLFEPCSWDGRQTSPTLTKQNASGSQRMPDKDNFNCVIEPFGISSKDSNAMKSSNPNSGVYKAETSRTVDCNGGNPSCNQGGIAIVESYSLQGNMIGRKDENGPQGDGVNKDVSFTLNATDRHAVALETFHCTSEDDKTMPLKARDYKDPVVVTEPSYGIDRAAFNQGKNAMYDFAVEPELEPTIVARGPGAVAHPYGFDPAASRDVGQYVLDDCGNTLTNGTCPGHHNGVIEAGYTVRRLTPTECARLQGFPDFWCQGLETEKPTDEEVYFWYKVFKTFSELTGSKMKTDKQIRKWLENPHSDSAEYKMWGNGVALPCVLFVLSSIVYTTQLERK